MQAVEFKSKTHDNVVDLPEELRSWNGRQVRVILLVDEEVAPHATQFEFSAISLKTRGPRFDREEANVR